MRAKRERSHRRERGHLHIIEDRGERIAILFYTLDLGWRWKTVHGEGHHARFRRALAAALRSIRVAARLVPPVSGP